MSNELEKLSEAVGTHNARWVHRIAEDNQHLNGSLTGELTSQLTRALDNAKKSQEAGLSTGLSISQAETILALVERGANTKALEKPAQDFIERLKYAAKERGIETAQK